MQAEGYAVHKENVTAGSNPGGLTTSGSNYVSGQYLVQQQDIIIYSPFCYTKDLGMPLMLSISLLVHHECHYQTPPIYKQLRVCHHTLPTLPLVSTALKIKSKF